MGSRIEVIRWCDNTDVHADEEVDASEKQLGIDGKWYDADLCDPCEENMTLAQLRVFLAEHGRLEGKATPSKASKATPNAAGGLAAIEKFRATGQRQGRQPASGERTIQCLWCPLPYTGTGFLKHIKDVHGFEDQKSAWGRTCPVCGQEGIDMMAVHASRHHAEIGARVPSDLFLWAKENKDPFGIYAERLKAGENVVAA